MKLKDRERVDGTRVTIGHRVYRYRGRPKVSRLYAAEYRNVDGAQVCRSLETSNRAQARRKALEIQHALEMGVERRVDSNVSIERLVESYLAAVKARGVAPKTEWKYRADLGKLKDFCAHKGITLARLFREDDLCRYRAWLFEEGYAGKTVQGAVTVAKQVFKWGWRQRLLRDYALAAVTFPKAKAKPQPCFTSAQVDKLIEVADPEERLAFALMGYAGLRIGEAEALRWEDLHAEGGRYSMIHVRRGGANGRPKDREDRFVPVHPKIDCLLGPVERRPGAVLPGVTERRLLKRLKHLCEVCEFEEAEGFKLHSFRHHFASLCANHHIAYRKALAWLGHSSSQMLDLYYHLHDEDSRQAMMALAESDDGPTTNPQEEDSPPEGDLRATGESTIEKTTQALEVEELAECLSTMAERAGFEPAVRFRAHTLSRRAP